MKLIFAGSPQLAADVLNEISKLHDVGMVITRTDARVGRRQELVQSPVAQLANSLGLPVLKANRIGSDELKSIAAVSAQLGIVVAYGAILPEAALRLHDWWNVHYSLLPSWRGATPAQHAILSGTGGGVSVFQIVRELDAGPVLRQIQLASEKQETAGEYLARLTRAAIPLVLDAISSPGTAVPQSGPVSYAPKLSISEARLNLAYPAATLERQVLALNPEPMAWCLTSKGERLRVLRAIALGDTDWSALQQEPPAIGELFARGQDLLLHCGEGTLLKLVEIQPAGRKAMPAGDWHRGARVTRLE